MTSAVFLEKKKKLRNEGFTLIELMLAISIFSFIAVVIYSSFRGGLLTWQRSDDISSRYHDARLALAIMARDMRNSVNISTAEFKGQSDRISFFTLLDKHADYCIRENGDIRAGSMRGLYKVTYYLIQDEAGVFKTLMRDERSYADSFKEDFQGQPRELADFLQDVSFEYAYADSENNIRYSGVWEDEKIVPAGVKIALELGKTKNNPQKVFNKYVFIPAGVMGKANE